MICRTAEEFALAMKNAKRGDMIFWDEAGVGQKSQAIRSMEAEYEQIRQRYEATPGAKELLKTLHKKQG